MFLLYHTDQKSFIFASPTASLCPAFEFSVVTNVGDHTLPTVLFLSYLCILIYSFIYQPFSLHTQPHIYGFAFDDALIQRHSFPCVARACVHTLLRFSQVFQSTSTSFRFLGFAV